MPQPCLDVFHIRSGLDQYRCVGMPEGMVVEGQVKLMMNDPAAALEGIRGSVLTVLGNTDHLKKCKMCGKWFVHRNKNAQYCNRVNKQDPHGRTCQQLGPPNDYNEKVSKSALLLECRRFNARMNYELQKGKITFEEFDEQILMAKVRKNAIIKEYGPNPPEKVVREYSEALRKQ